MGDVVPEKSQRRVAFVLGSEHALGEIAAAVDRVGGPPDDPYEDQELGEGICLGERCGPRHHSEQLAHIETFSRHPRSHALHAPESLHRRHGEIDGRSHREQKLEKIGDYDAPEAREGRVCDGDEEEEQDGEDLRVHPEDRLPLPTRHNQHDLRHRLHDPGDDEHILEESEPGRAIDPQRLGRPPVVTQLYELRVGRDPGAPPETGKEKDGRHGADAVLPPEPVLVYSALRDESRDDERRIRREGRRDHRRADDPPGKRSARDEELLRAPRGAFRQKDPDTEDEREIAEDDGNIPGRERQRHLFSSFSPANLL